MRARHLHHEDAFRIGGSLLIDMRRQEHEARSAARADVRVSVSVRSGAALDASNSQCVHEIFRGVTERRGRCGDAGLTTGGVFNSGALYGVLAEPRTYGLSLRLSYPQAR